MVNLSLYGFKTTMYIKDRAYFCKEVPDLTLLVNEAKFRLTKTEISSYTTTFSFDSSPSLRNIRRHQNHRWAKISSLFHLKWRFAICWPKFANFAVIGEVRLTLRICTALYTLHAALLPGQGIMRLEKNKNIELNIGIDEVFIKLFPWIPTALRWSRLIKGLVLLLTSTFTKIESAITYF